MRFSSFLATLPAVLAFAGVLHAGQLYGSVSENGKPVANAPVAITCAGEQTKGSTNADGTYRITVMQQGRCTFTLTGRQGSPGVLVFSYDKPTLYDLEVARKADGSNELRIR
ncbi:MAG: carboxypeptidase-like regulatory domain-containing protein [Bryobacteraceae bacterium]